MIGIMFKSIAIIIILSSNCFGGLSRFISLVIFFNVIGRTHELIEERRFYR